MRINTNVSSITAQENAVNTGNNIKSSLEKLSSGLRINKASDDASGLAIADKLRTQATSINQGVANGNSAVTLLQIADKSMAEQSNILDTVKSKLIQANTDTTSADGRESIRKDIVKLLEQLDNIAEQTNYNGNVLLQKSASDTSLSDSLSFQIGETKNDIISNTSVQSNTHGLGSKTTYENGSEIAQGDTVTLSSSESVTLKGVSASGSAVSENVTLTGDVDKLTLKDGMSFSNVNDETKAVLDALVGTNLAKSGDTYTVTTTGIDKELDLSSVSNVQMDVKSEGSSAAIKAGDVIENVSSATGSALNLALSDTSKFTEVSTGIYLAKTDQNISLTSSEQLDKTTPTELVSGAGNDTFNAGDTIKVDSITTGGLLDKALKDTNLFSGGTGGVYTVKSDFTAGSLFLGDGDTITITQGNPVSLAAVATGLTESNLQMNGSTTVYRATGGTAINIAASGGQIAASGDDYIKFTLTGATGAGTGGISYTVQKGDIITFSDNVTASGGGNTFSENILESQHFYHLGGGKYQAQDNATVNISKNDVLNVQRDVGGSGEETTVAGADADTLKGSENSAEIAVSSSSTFNVKNNETTAGNKLELSGTKEVSNGKDQLSSLANLKEGELTKELADSFQTVVDDAITNLNGYRGDRKSVV